MCRPNRSPERPRLVCCRVGGTWDSGVGHAVERRSADKRQATSVDKPESDPARPACEPLVVPPCGSEHSHLAAVRRRCFPPWRLRACSRCNGVTGPCSRKQSANGPILCPQLHVPLLEVWSPRPGPLSLTAHKCAPAARNASRVGSFQSHWGIRLRCRAIPTTSEPSCRQL